MHTSSPHETFLRKYVKPKAGRTLIVGARIYEGRQDRRKAYPEALGIDMLSGPGVDLVLNLEDKPPADIGTFAHIECWSVLEHSKRPWLLAANLEDVLEPGGTIHVTVPFAWRPHGYPDDYWRMSPSCVRDVLFPRISWAKLMLAQDRLRANERIPTLNKGGAGPSWLARTEVLAFGARA